MGGTWVYIFKATNTHVQWLILSLITSRVEIKITQQLTKTTKKVNIIFITFFHLHNKYLTYSGSVFLSTTFYAGMVADIVPVTTSMPFLGSNILSLQLYKSFLKCSQTHFLAYCRAPGSVWQIQILNLSLNQTCFFFIKDMFYQIITNQFYNNLT